MANIEKRINSDNSTSYRVKVRLKGFPIQTATFERLTDAKRWASSTESSLREGRYFKTSASRKHTLADLIDRYIRDILIRKPKSIAAQKTQLLWWKNEIGSYLLSNITPSLISICRDRLANSTSVRATKFSAATINRYMAALSHAITIAIKEWEWMENSPFQKVSKLKEPRGRVRFLSDEERRRLLKSCQESSSKYLYLITVLALSTGARKMEIVGLHWKDINFDKGTIILHDTKNGERRLLPLVGHALKLMKEHENLCDKKISFVFPNKNNKNPIDIRTPWETAIKRAEVKDFRFHDLRHSAASYLAMSGASIAEIAEVLGHKTLHMVKRYSHLSEAHTAGVVAKMNNKIFE